MLGITEEIIGVTFEYYMIINSKQFLGHRSTVLESPSPSV